MGASCYWKSLAMSLTRGDLWLSLELSLNFFLDYLIDADWSVCAANWMWVLSSAFERSLETNQKVDLTEYEKTIDVEGDYLRKLYKFPNE